MKVVNRKICAILITFLLIIEGCSLFLVYMSYSNKNAILDNVSLNEELNKDNMFVILLEQEDGTYKESSDGSWPTGYIYNANKSGCIDLNGNKLDGVLSYDATNNIATVDTGSTSYCYLYFNIVR